MANEPTDEDRARDLLAALTAHEKASVSLREKMVAEALAAERERCAKWHDEQRDGRAWQASQWAAREDGAEVVKQHETAARYHAESAAAIRALGRGK